MHEMFLNHAENITIATNFLLTAPMSRVPPPTHSMDALRAVRPPPGARRNLFHAHASGRRQNPTSVRPDTATIFTQPMEDELVERDQKGEYCLCAPHVAQRHLALGLDREADEEAGENTRKAPLVEAKDMKDIVAVVQHGAYTNTEQENQIIELYGKQNPHWDQDAVEQEIKVALASSLRKKVASLEDDRWMFEGDGDLKK